MKISYSIANRIRKDTIRVVINVEEGAEPTFKRGIRYQPTAVIVDYDRVVQRTSDDHDLDANEWSEEYSIQGHRILQSGALGQQSTRLWFMDHAENQYPWLQTALQTAHEEFLKIIKGWPDPEWPEESLPAL
jgi:hypothetical protein